MIDLKLNERERLMAEHIYILEDALKVCMDELAEIAAGKLASSDHARIARKKAKEILEEMK